MEPLPQLLIVDDEPINIQMLSAALKDSYRIRFATRAEQALDLACRFVPDLILLDVIMPDKSGYDLCRELKSTPGLANVPVIFVTGRDGNEDEAHGLAVGGADYLFKPVHPKIVKARVDNHIMLKRYRERLELLAMQDALTEVGNRRRFEMTLEQEWSRLKRTGRPLALLILDVDHFRHYNETYGLPEGDRCLQGIARELRQCMRRPLDLVCRIGGASFACLLPETERHGAAVVAEGIREMIAGLEMPHQGSPIGSFVTLSIGVAVAEQVAGLEATGLIGAADESLYQAKTEGRNRVGDLRILNEAEPVPVPPSPQKAEIHESDAI